MPTFNFTTGPSTLPDVGQLSYNSCVFSPLFETQVSGIFVKDNAERTTKEIEYSITAEGYVTLPDGHSNVEATLRTLERLLSAPGGTLVYSGRGIKISVNTTGGDRDVAWGPKPEILDITPLGGGRSAKIKWIVKTRIPPRVPAGGGRLGPVLQFNYDTSVSYDEAGYSSIRIAGITEIPMTRAAPASRSILQTADDFRQQFPGTLLATLDLTRYRTMHREFRVSRDKRTLEFDVQLEELPPMAMPPDITIARGTYTVKPVKQGAGLCNWMCTLNCTYTVPKHLPRRLAWFAFLLLLRERMRQGSIYGEIPAPAGNQNPGLGAAVMSILQGPIAVGASIIAMWRARAQRLVAQTTQATNKVILIDFNITEGVHLDSKTVTFSATWRMVTVFSKILLASGLWRRVPEFSENAWATSVSSISGYKSWLRERLDPTRDAIVDFGF